MRKVVGMPIYALVVFVTTVLLIVPAPVLGQSTQAVPAPSEKAGSQQPSSLTISQPHTFDDPDLTREVQLGVREKEYVGLVWWIPFEFWQVAGAKRGISPETTAQNFKALRDYTIVATFLAKVSGLGAFDFLPADAIRKDMVLRDATGNEYHVVPDPSQDAKNVAAIMKPMLGAAMGKAGENFDMLFFPARGKDGAVIADATKKGEFTVVLKNNLVGVAESSYQWRTPLTAVAIPKYCPVGKERVHADWDYCPRHGVALNPETKP